MTKTVLYSVIVIMVIILSVFIVRDFTAHMLLAEYNNSLNKKKLDIKRGERLLRASLRYSGTNAEPFYRLGKLYADQNPLGKSREDRVKSSALSQEFFKEALLRKPTDGRNRAVYAWYRGNRGNTREAIEYFNSAIDLAPTDAWPHMMYAMWCVNQVKRVINMKDTALFVEGYRGKQEKDEGRQPYEGRSVDGVAVPTLLRTGKLQWDKALSLGTGRNSMVYESLADMNLLNLELDKALHHYKQANSTLMQARCYIIMGNYITALNTLGAVIEAGRTPFWGNLAEVKRLLLEIAEYDSGNYRPFYWLGRYHTRIRKTEEAMGYFENAVHLNPKYIDARLKLAELYNRTGKIDLAIGEYERILEQSPKHKETTRLLSEAIREQYKDSDLLIKP